MSEQQLLGLSVRGVMYGSIRSNWMSRRFLTFTGQKERMKTSQNFFRIALFEGVGPSTTRQSWIIADVKMATSLNIRRCSAFFCNLFLRQTDSSPN